MNEHEIIEVADHRIEVIPPTGDNAQDTLSLVNSGGALVDSIDTDLHKAMVDRLSDNTRKAYSLHLAKFYDWCGDLPPTDRRLRDYIQSRFDAGLAPASIRLIVASVRFVDSAIPDSQKKVCGILTEQCLKGLGAKGRERGRGQKDGLVWNDVARLCGAIETEGSIIALRDSALLQVMSDALLRISEASNLEVTDIDLAERTLTIRHSKTDQVGRGEFQHLGQPTADAIKKYLSESGITNGFLFRRIRGRNAVTDTQLSARAIRDMIKRRCQNAGIPLDVAGHSLRIGSAMNLASEGATIVEMQNVGRWKSSDMPAHYSKKQRAKQSAIASIKYKE